MVSVLVIHKQELRVRSPGHTYIVGGCGGLSIISLVRLARLDDFSELGGRVKER